MNDFIERTELITPEPAVALAALLDLPMPDLSAGEPLPMTWHWLYLLDRVSQADLGPDGHPDRGTIPASTEPDRRRMWAGGHLADHGGLVCGEPASRRTRILKSEEKIGRTGRLTFLTVEHLITQRGELRIEEHQQLVYRTAPDLAEPVTAPADLPVVPPDKQERSIEITPVLLFRFSALTYNAHRIHYDRDYARDQEGYPGLLTHGPLQALVMAEVARGVDLAAGQHTSRRTYSYTLNSPLFDSQGLIAHAEPSAEGLLTYVRDRYGRKTASGVLA